MKWVLRSIAMAIYWMVFIPCAVYDPRRIGDLVFVLLFSVVAAIVGVCRNK